MSDVARKEYAHVVVIEPRQGWAKIPWRELLEYRDLLFLLVRRDFVAQYKQTILGPLWFVIQPLLTTLVFTVIFGKVAKIPTDGVPPMLFYLCGMLSWGYFAGCLGGTSSTFVANAGIFGKVYFPRLIVPLSVVVSRLVAFIIQLGTFLMFLFYFKFFTLSGSSLHPGVGVLLLPPLILLSAMIGLGVGLWISALTAKYRDLAFLSGFLVQLWMYATPVIYPVSAIPERWRTLLALNPMTGIVDAYRCIFLGTGEVNIQFLVVSAITSLIVLASGILVFEKTERTFIDTV